MPLDGHPQFVDDQIMDVEQPSAAASIAGAIADPARARILYCLMDGHAQTSTELSVVADVSPSTTSAHLNRLKAANLVKVFVQGKHRYYSLAGTDVARLLEGLSVLAGGFRDPPASKVPSRLRTARTCYDHLAGEVGVLLHDRFKALGFFQREPRLDSRIYDLSPTGTEALQAFGVDVAATRALRRQFAYDCLDWSERRPHLGGALAAAVLKIALRRKWVIPDLDSRALSVTRKGRSEMAARFGAKF
jgi:DNA-binding transcriptional ArsR family regulator